MRAHTHTHHTPHHTHTLLREWYVVLDCMTVLVQAPGLSRDFRVSDKEPGLYYHTPERVVCSVGLYDREPGLYYHTPERVVCSVGLYDREPGLYYHTYHQVMETTVVMVSDHDNRSNVA
jgi:hypothetical protein